MESTLGRKLSPTIVVHIAHFVCNLTLKPCRLFINESYITLIRVFSLEISHLVIVIECVNGNYEIFCSNSKYSLILSMLLLAFQEPFNLLKVNLNIYKCNLSTESQISSFSLVLIIIIFVKINTL